MTARFASLALGLALLFAACSSDGGFQLNGTAWELTDLRVGGSLEASEPTVMSTASFDATTVEGSDGCNRYRAAHASSDESLTFFDVVATGAACASIERTRQGERFLQALSDVRSYQQSGSTLELRDGEGEPVLIFRAAEDLPLAGISWTVEGYAADAGGLTSPLAGSEVTLGLDSDGTLGGLAGCNQYFGSWELDGDRLMIGDLAWTERACLTPEGVMMQEARYLSLLHAVAGFRTTLTDLELIDSEGAALISLRFGGRVR